VSPEKSILANKKIPKRTQDVIENKAIAQKNEPKPQPEPGRHNRFRSTPLFENQNHLLSGAYRRLRVNSGTANFSRTVPTTKSALQQVHVSSILTLDRAKKSELPISSPLPSSPGRRSAGELGISWAAAAVSWFRDASGIQVSGGSRQRFPGSMRFACFDKGFGSRSEESGATSKDWNARAAGEGSRLAVSAQYYTGGATGTTRAFSKRYSILTE
jgi:hypothetical protein